MLRNLPDTNLKVMHTKFLIMALVLFFSIGASAQNTAKPAPSKNVNGQLIDPTTNCVLRYYYYPNLEAYYDTQKNIYQYFDEGQWKTVNEIPAGYRGYSLYNKMNVIINDYDDDDPTQFHEKYKKKYPYITKASLKKMTAALN